MVFRANRPKNAEPIFRPSPEVITRRDSIDLKLKADEKPLWVKIVLGIATAALLPGAFGMYNVLNPSEGTPTDQYEQKKGAQDSYEDQALKLIGQEKPKVDSLQGGQE